VLTVKVNNITVLLAYFIDELEKTLNEIKDLQDNLENVNRPSQDSLTDLWFFIQRIGYVLGNLSALGCVRYASLVKKTSLIASTCTESTGKSVRVLISNLDVVVSIFRDCFAQKDKIGAFIKRFPEIEEKIDFCMSLVGFEEVHIKEGSDELSKLFKDLANEKLIDLSEGFIEAESVVDENKKSETAILDEKLPTVFMEEALNLLEDLNNLGDSLIKVETPGEEEINRLSDLVQKLKSLVVGISAMGFKTFDMLSRKTSLLATTCAREKEMDINVLIKNLNSIVSALAGGVKDLKSLKAVEEVIPVLESKMDACLSAAGVVHPEIKTQDELDDMLKPYSGS
jgi:hypothetical protein